MTFAHLAEIEAREPVPGFHGRFVHTDSVTVAFWDIDAGAIMPGHAHPHEQITSVIAGRFELTVASETRVLEAGAVVIVPGNVKHGGRAITACRLFDVFHPARDDYR
jgi:quercetin dioxygenase-like cupin family protein